MISTPVTYNDTIKEKVDSFNSIAHSEKRGTYWNNKDDLELEIVKKHIKEHYIHK